MAIAAALVVAALASFATPAMADEVPSGFSWTNYGPELMATSCFRANSCVAVGQGGAVLRSPATDEIPLAWTFVDISNPKQPDAPVDFVDVSCSELSCIAIASPANPSDITGSAIYRSLDGGETWAPAGPLPPQAPHTTAFASAIGCDPGEATLDTHVCYVAGVQGDVWRSTDDGQTWSAVPLPKTAPATSSFTEVACASEAACVAAGGDTVPSSVLLQGTTVTPLKTPARIQRRFAALACDSATRCVGTGGVGYYALLNIATKTWGTAVPFRTNPELKKLTIKSLSCPIEGSCVGLTGDGLALRSDALTDPTPNWVRRPVPLIIGHLGCFQTTCVGVGKMAAWYATFDLGGRFLRVNEVAKFDVAQCSAALSPTCVAGGTENVGLSRTGGELWTLPIADRGAFNTKSVKCTELSTCLIFGQFEGLYTTDFDAFRPRFGPVQSATGSETQQCVTDNLCVAVNESVVYTTFDGGLTQWGSNAFPKVRPSAMACIPERTNPVTCIVPIKDLILLGTMTQDAAGRPHWDWRYTNADADNIINAVACSPEGSQCTAAGVNGMVLTTTGDGNGLMDWREFTVVGKPKPGEPATKPLYTSASCPAAGFCLVGGAQGTQSIVASTTNNWADFSYDRIGDLRASPVLSGFGCESINRCIAVGSTVLVGVRNPPANGPSR